MINDIIIELEDNLLDYCREVSSAQKSRTNSGTLSLISSLKTQTELWDVAKEFSDQLRNWKEEFQITSKLTEKSKLEYISATFKYVRHLTLQKKIPTVIFPSIHKNYANKTKSKTTQIKVKASPAEPDELNEYIFRPSTGRGDEKGFLHDVSFLSKFKNGKELAKCFREYQAGFSYSRQTRNNRVFTSLVQFESCGSSLDSTTCKDKETVESLLQKHISEILRDREKRGLITINSDLIALNKVYKHFARKRFFPFVNFPKPLKGMESRFSKLKQNCKLLAQSFAETERKGPNGEIVNSAFSMIEKTDDEFLCALERDERHAFNMIRNVCIREARRTIEKFDEGQKLISNCDIDYIRTVYQQTGRLVDPNVKGPKDKQSLSFFSPDHPNGLANLVGYYWYEYNGIVIPRAFPGAYFIDHYGVQNIKNYLGLNNTNSLPLFIIIVGETGVNVSSLERAKVSDKYDNNLILNSTNEDGYEKFEVKKPRASKSLEKYVKVSSTKNSSGEKEINAHTCLTYILKMTAQYRKWDNSKYLWIGPYFASTPYAATRISSMSFKSQLKRLLKTNPDFNDLKHKFFTRANIRVSAGILKWFESGGDALTVANFLGNSVDTSMKNYIPLSIQDALYRRTIRKFQYSIIVASTIKLPMVMGQALKELDKIQISKIIEEVKTNGDLVVNSLLIDTVEDSSTAENEPDKTILVVSPLNIAILKLINDSILEFRLANPNDSQLKLIVENRDQNFWIELWSFTNLSLRNSPDRALKRIYNQGLEQALKMTEQELQGL
jgi:hypothetical protein